jgi:hypothetical protein
MACFPDLKVVVGIQGFPPFATTTAMNWMNKGKANGRFPTTGQRQKNS